MTSSAALGGTAARPAGALRQGGFGPGQASRLSAAIAIVVALHVALLAFRPGASGASQPTSAAPVMAVRVVHVSQAVAPPSVVPTVEPTPITPAAAAARAADVTPAPPPPARTAQGDIRPGRDGRADGSATAIAAPSHAEPAPTPRSLAAAPDYAFGATLNPGPRPLDEIEPDYPDVHLREGVVVLRLLIGATGHVDDVAVVRSAPEGVFEQAALDAFGKARFAPGLADGTPVKSQITVEVQFMPINRGARISGRTY
jgi:periplasmic protein TonB